MLPVIFLCVRLARASPPDACNWMDLEDVFWNPRPTRGRLPPRQFNTYLIGTTNVTVCFFPFVTVVSSPMECCVKGLVLFRCWCFSIVPRPPPMPNSILRCGRLHRMYPGELGSVFAQRTHGAVGCFRCALLCRLCGRSRFRPLLAGLHQYRCAWQGAGVCARPARSICAVRWRRCWRLCGEC